MKNLAKQNVRTLNTEELKSINGGLKLNVQVCRSPSFKVPGQPCPSGTHPDPANPHCICCAD